jgi:predicted esterase
MTWKAIAAASAAAALLGTAAGGSPLQATLRAEAAQYHAHLLDAVPVVGSDSALDYLQRLNDDRSELDDPHVPYGYSAPQWHAYLKAIARLDLSAARQILTKSFQPMAAIRGLGETFVRSSKDGTMQPVAVYVPPGYVPSKAAPLVVFLHGHPQSETELIAPDYVAHLADATGTIVIAPYGRGYYDFRGSASDVYDALDAALGAFTIDPRRKFLVGYSMGGFSVYEVAPLHPQDWSAVMSIAGALLGHDATKVVAELKRTPFYVLTGSSDTSIPTRYPAATAAYLQSVGVPVSFYSQPHGIHRLVTLLPILTQAWNDMDQGIVRAPPPGFSGAQLPATPMMPVKP